MQTYEQYSRKIKDYGLKHWIPNRKDKPRQGIKKRNNEEAERTLISYLSKGLPLSWAMLLTTITFNPLRASTITISHEDAIRDHFGKRNVREIYSLDSSQIEIGSRKPYHYLVRTKEGLYAARMNRRETRVTKSKRVPGSLDSLL